MPIRRFIKSFAPDAALQLYRRLAAAQADRRFAGRAPREVFGAIYRNGQWGQPADDRFCSGSGSHVDQIVAPYVLAVRAFLEEFAAPPVVVDLGCGDFHVGSQLRDGCAQFVGVDVVPALIERNQQRYPHLSVDFKCLDLTSDTLPTAQVALLRQVLQHLSNAQIATIVPKLYQYGWLVVSEHLPSAASFKPNRDKPTGPGVRERFGSGVVLTQAPFGLRVSEERTLCSVAETSGVVRTVAYRLAN